MPSRIITFRDNKQIAYKLSEIYQYDPENPYDPSTNSRKIPAVNNLIVDDTLGPGRFKVSIVTYVDDQGTNPTYRTDMVELFNNVQLDSRIFNYGNDFLVMYLETAVNSYGRLRVDRKLSFSADATQYAVYNNSGIDGALAPISKWIDGTGTIHDDVYLIPMTADTDGRMLFPDSAILETDLPVADGDIFTVIIFNEDDIELCRIRLIGKYTRAIQDIATAGRIINSFDIFESVGGIPHVYQVEVGSTPKTSLNILTRLSYVDGASKVIAANHLSAAYGVTAEVATNKFKGAVQVSDTLAVLAPFGSSVVGLFDPTTHVLSDGVAHGQGASAYCSPLLLSNGRVLLTPYNASNVAIYDSTDDSITIMNHDALTTAAAYFSSILLSNGTAFFVPYVDTHIRIYDADLDAWACEVAHGKGLYPFLGAIELTGGTVVMSPFKSANIGLFNTNNNQYSDGPAHGKDSDAFCNVLLLQNGKVLLIPYSSTHLGLYDPDTNTYADGPAHGESTPAFSAAIELQSGLIALIPYASNYFGIYDPVANTYTRSIAHGMTNASFNGIVLLSDNRLLMIPNTNSGILMYEHERDLSCYVYGLDDVSTTSPTPLGQPYPITVKYYLPRGVGSNISDGNGSERFLTTTAYVEVMDQPQ